MKTRAKTEISIRCYCRKTMGVQVSSDILHTAYVGCYLRRIRDTGPSLRHCRRDIYGIRYYDRLYYCR